MYIIGIDIGKRHHEATVIDSQGTIIGKSLRFANSHTGFHKLLKLVRSTAGENEAVFGMEATGHYWLALYTHLRKEGYTVHVLTPFNRMPYAACISARPRTTVGIPSSLLR